MVYLLTAFGQEALEAHGGSEGIEKARREKPDLILLDIHMPRMDGYEVARLLGEDSECRGIPIVAVTALAMVGDREKILASRFSGYIAKPIDPETFPAQIQGFLGMVHRARPLSAKQWPQQEVPSRTAPHEKSAVILLVDNTQANINLVRTILESFGYELVGALSAREGFDLARRTKPDLIISDVHMFHQDGYEFLRMVQADPGLSKIPFFFLSSSVWSNREKERALTLGVKKFISRPVEPQALLSVIESCLQQGKGA
jgi:two-component system cell cycle response regulator